MSEAFVLSHLGLGDNICMLGAVFYLTSLYEKVFFVVKERYQKNIELFIENHPKITLYVVKEDEDISPPWGCTLEHFLNVTRGKKVFLSGLHIFTTTYNSLNNFPQCLYQDMKLDFSIFYNYFPKITLPIHPQIKNLFSFNLPIIFCHDSSSMGEVNLLTRHSDIQLAQQSQIIVNPCKNMYSPDHPFFHWMETLVFLPVAEYIPLIEQADQIIITDSCFWCLTVHLKTKPTAKKFCYQRYHYIDFSKTDSSFVYIKL